ncbi:MAG: putative DNA-binding domain-containing protein [Rhodospirillaceae bacterium]|nr:putative DNA-binding domain-containing protein [Rhodospirillaceae bacterium]
MPTSPDRIAAFAGALWATERAVPEGLLPAARFALHRNNVYASLVGCLAARFPVILRLLGEDCFRQSTRHFVEVSPPRSPVLMEYGAGFADFLAGFAPLRELSYLADVARLEWHRHVALHGADAAPLDRTTLAAVPPDRMPDLVLALHPTAEILSSAYPVLSIWQANAVAAATVPVGADLPGESVLIVRPLDEVLLLPLSVAAAGFLRTLMRGLTLGEAAEAAGMIAADFDLSQALAPLLRDNVFTGFHLANSCERT